jgi:hypothetical protein
MTPYEESGEEIFTRKRPHEIAFFTKRRQEA